ncbi:flagellar hook protein FlgE [Stutzerimonas chloritidismutans]|uniref:flagellar hook protein FlgE n=1 Tax=Stutzerimonas chloritidismutans TaxID=203192 RepID=UPI00384C1BAD
MSFNIGLSGMRAASKDLNVTGNNIANAGTAGFKQSRAEFADVYAASMMGTGKNPVGSGVLLSNVSQQFNQGNINYTQNALDLAINGNGFFEVSNNGALSYTRAGYFGTNKEGFLVDNFGYNLRGYSATDGVLGKDVQNLKIQATSQEPKATTKIEQSFNLNSSDSPPGVTPFNHLDPSTYNSSTTTRVYDSLGNSHTLNQYFIKDSSVANGWNMVSSLDGGAPTAGISVTFDSSGRSISPSEVNYSWDLNNGAISPAVFTLDMRSSTQYASAFATNSVSQDGYTTGDLAGLEIGDDGKIFARYTNGQSKVQGQVVLANFANVQGLTPVGKTQWVQSLDSGEPVRNPPGTGTLGALQSGALEDSNVELSDQLVNLIVAQRNYQANAKTIETESAITQTIINLR